MVASELVAVWVAPAGTSLDLCLAQFVESASRFFVLAKPWPSPVLTVDVVQSGLSQFKKIAKTLWIGSDEIYFDKL
jgi:hypothetical protein